jgi:hypothetical protein
MDDKSLENAILQLAQMGVDLDTKGGPAKAGRLFEEIYEKQKEILDDLGLPATPYYTGLLEFDAVPWGKELEQLIALLYRDAEKNKGSPQLSEIELLEKARETKRDPSFIFPQLNFTTHLYTVFVYNNILLTGKDTPENVLKELKTASQGDLLNDIGIVSYSSDWLKDIEGTISSFEAKGLHYIREYLEKIIKDLENLGFKVKNNGI